MLIDSQVQQPQFIKLVPSKTGKGSNFSTFVILLPSTTLIGFLAERNTMQGYDL